jgi:hypothetical protein
MRRWFPASCIGALDGPFVVLFEKDGADEPGDGVVVGKDADDGSAFDLAGEPFEAVGGVQFRPMVGGKAHIGEHVGLSLVHEGGQFGQLGPELVGDPDHGPLAASALSCAKAAAMKAETTRWLLLPAWARALRMVWTRQRRQVAFISLAMAALMPSWASETTSPDLIRGLTPRRPRRLSLRKNSLQKVSTSDGPMSMPSTSRRPSALTPTAYDRNDAGVAAHLHIGRIDPRALDPGAIAFERAIEEGLNPFLDRLARGAKPGSRTRPSRPSL